MLLCFVFPDGNKKRVMNFPKTREVVLETLGLDTGSQALSLSSGDAYGKYDMLSEGFKEVVFPDPGESFCTFSCFLILGHHAMTSILQHGAATFARPLHYFLLEELQ